MTSVMETEKKVIEKQKYLSQVEFLEFIGRIAWAKFLGSELEDEMDLASKIEFILDEILPLVGVHRKDREEDYIEVSDSSSDNY